MQDISDEGTDTTTYVYDFDDSEKVAVPTTFKDHTPIQIMGFEKAGGLIFKK